MAFLRVCRILTNSEEFVIARPYIFAVVVTKKEFFTQSGNKLSQIK